MFEPNLWAGAVQDRLLESECKIISVMTVVCGDGKHTWVDFEAVRQPTRASFWSGLTCSHVHRNLCQIATVAKLQMVFSLSSQWSWHQRLGLRLEAGSSPPNRLPAVVHRGPPRTKSVFSRDRGPACWPLHSASSLGRKERLSQRGKGHWSDEKIIPPPPPRLRRWTSCGVKPFVSGDTARLGRKDMSGKLQNLLMFLRRWKDLYNTFRTDGLSHVGSRQSVFVDMFK